MTRTLTGRAVLVTGLVAVVSVLITAVVALPTTLRAANTEAKQALAQKANLAARVLGAAIDTPAAQAREAARVRTMVEQLRADGVEAVVIRRGRPEPDGLPARIVAEVAAGRSVSQVVRFRGRLLLAEGRPAGAESAGDGIVLLTPGVHVGAGAVLGRLWLALGAGLLAGAVAGVLLARRLGRPLRDAAVAARRISAGDRTVQLPTAAPAEVAAVSAALNDLAVALATSENRQRTFLTSISHELRTPLTAMKGYAEALADGVVDGEAARRAGATMLAESERLDRLVEDLLALARLEADDFPLSPVRVDLLQIATDAAASWEPRCAAVGVPLRIEVPGHPVVVHTDPGRVRQVLDGLLENALRVVPQGAPVVIAAFGEPREPSTQQPAGPQALRAVGRFPAASPLPPYGGYGVLQVRDGGPGLTDEDLAVVFERGVLQERYRGVRKVGSGLGLALAHRLVRRLGGRIEAGHAAEGGARMTVLLPRS
jgi:two-component system sensor histidine kinase BaeS